MSKIVLGGGIGGLSAAYYLQTFANDGIKLVEKSERFGGWIRSTQTKNGTIFEHGPRSLRPAGEPGKNTLGLMEELELYHATRPILKTNPAAKNRMIFVNENLHTLPNSFGSLFKTISPFSKPLIVAAFRDLTAPRKIVQDESIYDFIERRLGKELAEYAVSALIRGICAGDAKEISVKFMLKNVFENEQKHGSIIKGFLKSIKTLKDTQTQRLTSSAMYNVAVNEKWSAWSFDGGLETLPKRVEDNLRRNGTVTLETNKRCDKITFKDNCVRLNFSDKEEVASHVFCAIPSRHLAQIIDDDHPFLKEELLSIPFVDVAVVNLEYEENVLQKQGFGFLVPPSEPVPILGVVFDTCCFPQDGKTVLTVMMGGKWFEELFGSNPSEEFLYQTAVRQVSNILKITNEPKDYLVSILRQCIPQYILGHYEKVERIRDYISTKKLPITLIGSSYDGVGINDVILSARNSVEKHVEHII